MKARPWYEHLMALWFLTHVTMLTLVGAGQMAPELGSIAEPWNRVQRFVDRELHRPYGALLGPKQYWSMFGGVGRNSHQMHIEIEDRNGAVRPVFAERSDVYTWNRTAFDQYRWREWINQLDRMKGKSSRFGRFVRWVGPIVAQDYPEACRVWVRVARGRARTPEELRAGERRVFDGQSAHIVWVVKGREGCP